MKAAGVLGPGDKLWIAEVRTRFVTGSMDCFKYSFGYYKGLLFSMDMYPLVDPCTCVKQQHSEFGAIGSAWH